MPVQPGAGIPPGGLALVRDAHSYDVAPARLIIGRHVEGKGAVPVDVVSNPRAIPPDLRLAEAAVEPDFDPLPGHEGRPDEGLSVPADTPYHPTRSPS